MKPKKLTDPACYDDITIMIQQAEWPFGHRKETVLAILGPDGIEVWDVPIRKAVAA